MNDQRNIKTMDVIWDMETSDPDDFLTLLFLLGHSMVNLKAVTIMPGSTHQVGLVREALSWFNLDIPVGSFNIEHPKECVSGWHYRAYGNIEPSDQSENAAELILRLCDEDTTIITGGPLRNIAKAITLGNNTLKPLKAKAIVVQGGFAGEGVVPEEKQMKKFKGKRTAATYNLSHHKSAKVVLEHPGIYLKRFVSKNVCHRVLYDEQLHHKIASFKSNSKSLELIWHGMEKHLYKHLEKPSGPKKIHDLLAACCAIDPNIGEWKEVSLFWQKGEWGAELSPGSNTWIIIDYNRKLFEETLMMI